LDTDIVLAEVEREGRGVSSDETADFVRAYERHRAPVFRYLRGRTPTDEDAADLTAATFERAWTARHSFRGTPDQYPAWLFAIARRMAIDAGRRRRREWPHDEVPEAADETADPAELAQRHEEDRVLLARLARLPDAQRDALLLRYAGGLTASQIGVVIGKRQEATQKLISRALTTLKEVYGADD
jgi:RNA polymerase sigma-70 factor (ECF subfamily)